MIANWLRRTALLALCASAALLAACGSSTVESAVKPTRIVAFGDGLSDLGEKGSRYTVNDGSINIWTQQFASSYGLTLTTASAGGTSYAQGNARVALTPDAAGSTSTKTITQQIDTFLATGSTISSSDVFILSGGTADVITNLAAYSAGTLTSAQFLANMTTAGQALATQVRRLLTAGAKYVLVSGTYDLSRSPLAIARAQTDILSQASLQFNNTLLVNIADLGSNVLYVDGAYYYNLLTGLPGTYNFQDATTVVCTSVDSGPGIGTGTGQLNSALCNTGTLIGSIPSNLTYNSYIFADNVYFTPNAQRLFGSYAYTRFTARF